MALSRFQWLMVILGDLSIRSGFFFVMSLNILTIPIAFFLSLLHLGVLISAALFVSTFEMSRQRAIGVTLIATNAVFCTIFVSLWLLFIKSGHQTSCVANECDWIKGSLTATGLKTIVFTTVMLVAMNLIPYLLVSLSALQRRGPATEQN